MKALLTATTLAFAAVTARADLSLSAAFSIYDNHGGNPDGTPFTGSPILTGTRSFFASALYPTYDGVSLSPLGETDQFYFPLGNGTPYGAQISGSFVAAADGTFNFGAYSDDGSALYIDGTLVVNNGGPHSPTAVFATDTLTAGTHTYLVNYFEDFGGEALVNAYFDPRLVAVPEPTTIALISGGGLAVLVAARRRIGAPPQL